MKKVILPVLIVSTLLTICLQLHAQTKNKDTELYHRWQITQNKDSTYHRAYQKYQADSADNTPAIKLSPKAIELEALSAAFTEAFLEIKDYDKAFLIALHLEEKLPQISEKEYPSKRAVYYKLGEAYYLFLNFHRSIKLLEKALSPAPASFLDRTNLDALNIMGICYANIGQMDTSNDYFRAVLMSNDIVLDRPLYNAYALSHLGCNAMLTGHYYEALDLSDVAWPVLRKNTDNYGHLAGMCYCRGRSLLEKGEYKQASAWIDSLVYFANRDDYNKIKRTKQSYLLRADYYTAMGDASQSKVYNDSLVGEYKKGEQQFTSQYIVSASQQYNNEKIAERESKLKFNRICIAVISLALLCSVALGLLIYSLYRKKNAAYKVLAQKALQWAVQDNIQVIPASICDENEIDPPPSAGTNGETKALATEECLRIIALVDREMTENHAYREDTITLDSLAARLYIHRNTLSGIINRVTGDNFKQYINSFRIKEAVSIISEKAHKELYICELYERVGFSNRSTFSRTFKQFTGLSPLEFQKQKNSLTKNHKN